MAVKILRGLLFRCFCSFTCKCRSLIVGWGKMPFLHVWRKNQVRNPQKLGRWAYNVQLNVKNQGLSLRRIVDLLGNKTAQRLLEDKEMRRSLLSLPQPYTFKPTSNT